MSTNISEPQLSTASVIQIPTSIDYTSRDYTGLVASMLIFAAQAMPEWNTSSSEGDMGIMLMELWAYVGDILSYYTDRIGQEAYIGTATQRLSLLNIAQLLGYVPSNGTPATGTVTFVTANPGPAVDVPAGTQVQSNFNSTIDAPLTYQVVTGGVCPANGGTVTLNVSQGTTFSSVPIGTSDGLAGQLFTLPQTGILDGSTQIFVQTTGGNTNEWIEVSSFVNSNQSAMVYTLFTDANDNTNITFGDGINGLIPGLGLAIYATFTTFNGSDGNCGVGIVNTIISNLPGVSINQLAGGVADSSIMSGGADAESNDSIRANAPLTFQTQQRAVSLDDFASLCLTVPGVTLANATANHSTSVNLYFLGPNGAAPSTTLQSNVLAFFQGPPQKFLAGVTLSTPLPTLIAVDVGTSGTPATLVVQNNFSQLNVAANVQTALTQLLSPPNVSFGQLLQVASIYQAIMAVPGVQYCVINVMTREDVTQANTNAIQFRQSEVPIPGTFYFTVSGGQ
jgi:uncharacterized phage protein gp47/JayE